MVKDVFISYSSKDRDVACAVYENLNNRGIDCWIAPEKLPPGKPFQESLIEAINDSRVFILIFSSNSNESKFVPTELNIAFSKGIPIIPFRIEDVLPSKPLQFYLSLPHWLDAFPDPNNSLDKLAKAVTRELKLAKLDKSKTISKKETSENDVKNYILGIDLGTYNSAAAVVEIDQDGNTSDPEMVFKDDLEDENQSEDNFERLKSFPSFVSYFGDGSIHQVGSEAKERLIKDPKHVVWGVKRLLGKTYTECKDQEEIHRFSYSLKPDPKSGKCTIQVGEKEYKPEEVSAEIVKKIKEEAEKETGVIFNEVVISIPAYFDAIHSTPIIEAAKMAEFVNIKTIPEPVAATIAYNIPIIGKFMKILVFDLGAGTLDVTTGNLAKKGPNPSDITFQSKKTTGNTHLGGMDMDDRMYDLIIGKMGLVENDLSEEDSIKIRYEAEKAKIFLSRDEEAEVDLIINDVMYSIKVNQEEFEISLKGGDRKINLIDECREQVVEAIKKSRWTPKDIEQIILIGGPSAMPCMIKMLKEIFSDNLPIIKQLEEVENGNLPIDPMEAVAKGAALSSVTRKLLPHPYGYGFIDLEFAEDQINEIPVILVPVDSPFPTKIKRHIITWYQRAPVNKIEIIQEIPKSDDKKEYWHLGFFDLANKGFNGDFIEIGMHLNENEELITNLKGLTSGQEVNYVGVGHLERIPKICRSITRVPNGGTIYNEPEINNNALISFIKWSRNLYKLCSAKMEDIDNENVAEIINLLKKLNEDLAFYAMSENNEEIDITKLRKNYHIIINSSNELLHNARQFGLIGEEADDLQIEKDNIISRIYS